MNYHVCVWIDHREARSYSIAQDDSNAPFLIIAPLSGLKTTVWFFCRRASSVMLLAGSLPRGDRQVADSVIDLPMKRNAIAGYLGLTFEAVSRILKPLKELHYPTAVATPS